MSLKSATKVDTNRVELEVEVDSEAFEAAVSKAYKKNIGKMSVPGFRKGKAPRHLVEKLYGESVFYDDAVNDLYPTALQDAIEKSDFEYIEDKIDLDVTTVGKEGLVFKAVITVKPEVEVGEYKGLKAEKKTISVTDEDVDKEISMLQERNSRLVTVEGRPAQNGDTVTFDFEGFNDGVPFEGGKAESFSLELGSGRFIPGFEEQIEGKSTDEEFEVNVTFPEDYQAEELKGKPAVFKCKLHEIKEKEMPELNDDFAKDVSEFDTLDQLKEDLKGKLKHQREHAAEDEFESTLLEHIVEGLKGDIPEAMFEHRVDDSIMEFEQRLKSQGLNIDNYLNYTGMDAEGFRNGFRQQAEKQVKIRLALEKIARLENITISDEEIGAEYTKLAEQYKMDVDKIKSFVSEKELVKDLEVGKALDLVKESAEIS
ncbi:MAG: trigger factor [Oscillospiraceae bacterium]|nr:trigger factor [Oscillospiraceae bacterium]MDD4413554.1 trigger factor [Oscillospiraceae bacterium]